ncbi:MAG: FumA C-terminus/TtdB family hydratase beta subunit [Fervidobacterium sp.]
MTDLKNLKAGEFIKYTGSLIVMRDAAQKRLVELEQNGEKLPVNLSGKTIFYAGPTFSKERMIIGPTTAKRMDKFLEFLAKHKIMATIGKGTRSQQAVEIIKKHQIPYFVTPSGCAAYLSTHVVSWKLLAFDNLGPEAIYEIQVFDFPILVAIDIEGNKIF